MRMPCIEGPLMAGTPFLMSPGESAAMAQVMDAIQLLRSRWAEYSPADAALLAQVREENAVLARELAAVQRRTTRLVRQQAHTIEQLRATVVRLRAEVILRDTTIAALREPMNRDSPAPPGSLAR